MEIYYLYALIFFYSLIQSIFGIGLLLFGTPSLIILGYSFTETLWILLPASCALSLFQIIENRQLIESKRQAYFLTIPALVASLILIIKLDYFIDIKKIVGFFLLLTAALRLSDVANKWSARWVKKSKGFMYILIGSIHGISNLGGAPLSVLSSSLYSDSNVIRANIAFVYFILALSQLGVLFIFETAFFSSQHLICDLLAQQ